MSSGGAAVMSRGITITGAQILEGIGIFIGIGLMLSKISMHGTPNSKISSGGSYGEYDSNGNLSYRVDTTGKAHFIKELQDKFLPHIHRFKWKLINGIWRYIEEVFPFL